VVDEVSVEMAWEQLSAEADALLIDVRTRAEWTYVGLPDLTALRKEPLLLEWQTYPDNRVQSDFTERLTEALGHRGAGHDTTLLFLCRSGVRSLAAAQAMAAKGFSRCRNVAGGFEGQLDAARHRGVLAGWKARGLPWVQG
jgi:rhodanese-related sulfurtransferase